MQLPNSRQSARAAAIAATAAGGKRAADLGVMRDALGSAYRIILLQGSNERVRWTFTGAPTVVAVAGGPYLAMGKVVSVAFTGSLDLTGSGQALTARIEGGASFAEVWDALTVGITGATGQFAPTGMRIVLPRVPVAGRGYRTSFKLRSSVTQVADTPAPTGNAPAPTPTAKAPAVFRVWNWIDPANPVLAGAINIDVRDQDLVYTDSEYAADAGVTGVRRPSTTIVWEGFEWGGMAFDCPAANNAEANEPVYQFLGTCKPHGRWATFPAADTFNQATDLTFPPPFKADLIATDGTVLKLWEMHDGLPINSPELQIEGRGTKPLRPHWNCANMLPYQSARLKLSPRANKYVPGVTADTMRPTAAKSNDSCNPAMILMDHASAGRQQSNGANHWYAMPKWPDIDRGYYNWVPGEPLNDPHLFNPSIVWQQPASITGWKYEPGSISGHDWFCGPGGVRFDRAVVPTPLMLYLTNPSGTRLVDGTPLRDMVDEWGLAYFNHSCMFTRDVKTLATLPPAETFMGWSYSNHYYGDREDYVPGGKTRHVNAVCVGNGGYDPDEESKKRFYQRFGLNGDLHRVWNGYNADAQHAHQSAALWALSFNSPMHMVAAKHFWINNNLAQLGERLHYGGSMLHRQGAYRMMHKMFMWKLATPHPVGVARSVIDAELNADMARWADEADWSMDPQQMDWTAVGIRRFGRKIYLKHGTNPDKSIIVDDNPLGFYWALTFAMLKTTGLWAYLRAGSPVAVKALDWMIATQDRNTIEHLVKTQGRFEGQFHNVTPWVPHPGPDPTLADVDASWAAKAAREPAANANHNWVRDPDGSLQQRASGQHLRAQYVYMRKDYYAEIAHPDLDEAVSLLDGWYADWYNSRVAPGAPEPGPDWKYRIPPYGRLKPPVTV